MKFQWQVTVCLIVCEVPVASDCVCLVVYEVPVASDYVFDSV